MRFVTVKTEAQQAAAGIHKVREMLIKQRTMLINAMRGLMAEFGIVVAEGPRHVGELVAILAPVDQRIPRPLHGWCGRGGTVRCPPIPIIDPNPTFMTAPPGEPLRRNADDRVPCGRVVTICA
jgi:hypothetical protein